MREAEPPIASLTPSLDLIQTRAYDAPHSEWRGLGRILQNLLFSAMLTKEGGLRYIKEFQTFVYLYGWPRIQSPAFYIWSWSLAEAGRATILTPLILRSCSRPNWFRARFLQTAGRVLNRDNRLPSSFEAVIQAFRIVAQCNSVLGSQKYTDSQTIHDLVFQSRRSFQGLIRCASNDTDGETFTTNTFVDKLDHQRYDIDELAASGDTISGEFAVNNKLTVYTKLAFI